MIEHLPLRAENFDFTKADNAQLVGGSYGMRHKITCHLEETPPIPLLLMGPPGCGKTFTLYSQLRLHYLRTQESPKIMIFKRANQLEALSTDTITGKDGHVSKPTIFVYDDIHYLLQAVARRRYPIEQLIRLLEEAVYHVRSGHRVFLVCGDWVRSFLQEIADEKLWKLFAEFGEFKDFYKSPEECTSIISSYLVEPLDERDIEAIIGLYDPFYSLGTDNLALVLQHFTPNLRRCVAVLNELPEMSVQGLVHRTIARLKENDPRYFDYLQKEYPEILQNPIIVSKANLRNVSKGQIESKEREIIDLDLILQIARVEHTVKSFEHRMATKDFMRLWPLVEKFTRPAATLEAGDGHDQPVTLSLIRRRVEESIRERQTVIDSARELREKYLVTAKVFSEAYDGIATLRPTSRDIRRLKDMVGDPESVAPEFKQKAKVIYSLHTAGKLFERAWHEVMTPSAEELLGGS